MNSKLLKHIFLFSFVVLIATAGFAQKKKIEKAQKEFDTYAYIDAREIYLTIVENGYVSAQIYKNLGDTYYWNSDYDNAAKWYRKAIAEFPAEVEAPYYYRAAQSLKSLKLYKESDELMKMYAAIGGNGVIIQNFKNDPDYLNSIAFEKKAYELQKVAVNTKYSDFGPTYYGDKIVYASSTVDSEGAALFDWNKQPYLDLFVADMDAEGKLSNPQPLSGEINTRFHESSAVFTKDGGTVYFTRNNFIDGKKGKDKNKTIRLKLYRATKSGDNFWTNIVELPFNSKEYSVAHPALSLDEKRLYFSSDMPGTLGMSDLWYVDIEGDNTYSEPVNMGSAVNTEARESFPFVSEKNNLYYSSDGRAGLGGYDIYVTALNDVGLSSGKVTNIGEPANSSQDDFGFIIKESTRRGYMSSSRDGEKGSIDDEIYRLQESCNISITGVVTDLDTGDLLPGAEVSLLDENNQLVEKVVVGDDASFNFSALCESQYSIRGTKDRYDPNEKVVSTPDKTGTIDVPLPLKLNDPCPPNDLGCRLKLQPIYFDFDKSNIRPDAAIELEKIAAAMRLYPQLILKIESHTDSRGGDKYNESLSDRRAKSTLEYLVTNRGIARERFTEATGYGEYQLINECSDGVKCSEEKHQLNRRSMFLIQN